MNGKRSRIVTRIMSAGTDYPNCTLAYGTLIFIYTSAATLAHTNTTTKQVATIIPTTFKPAPSPNINIMNNLGTILHYNNYSHRHCSILSQILTDSFAEDNICFHLCNHENW